MSLPKFELKSSVSQFDSLGNSINGCRGRAGAGLLADCSNNVTVCCQDPDVKSGETVTPGHQKCIRHMEG